MSRTYDETPEDRMATALERIADALEEGAKATTALERIADALDEGLMVACDVGLAHVLLQAMSVKAQVRALESSEDVASAALAYIDEVIDQFLAVDDDESEPTNAEES